MVRRRTGGDVALIAAYELQSLIETTHPVRSPPNAQRLLTAVARAREERYAPTPVDALRRLGEGDA